MLDTPYNKNIVVHKHIYNSQGDILEYEINAYHVHGETHTLYW